MQLGYQVPLLQQALANAAFTTDWIRVPVGSCIRLDLACTAIAGAPAASFTLQLMNNNGDPVIAWTQAVAAIGSWNTTLWYSTEWFRVAITASGAGTSVTVSADAVVCPPDSTPA
jgi:multisubunit Na+/H+ antiporter MnhB subunit